MQKILTVFSLVALATACSESANLTEQDVSAVLKAEDLALWMEGFVPDPTKESLVKTKEFDDSYDIEYTYENQDGDPPPLPLSFDFRTTLFVRRGNRSQGDGFWHLDWFG